MKYLVVPLIFIVCNSVMKISYAETIRYQNSKSNVPVATAVEVPPLYSTVYLSGKLPIRNSYDNDTKKQTIQVLKEIEKSLLNMGLSLADIVRLQVFLVGVPELNNRMDIDGFSQAYIEFFGTKQRPHLPSRTLVQVAALSNNMLVEIEATAVRKVKSEISSEKDTLRKD